MADVDAGRAIDRMTAFLERQLDAAGLEGYVLGVSGGLDSAVAATLAVDAVGPDAVTGLLLPAGPTAGANERDARGLCGALGIDHHEVSIEPLVASLRELTPFAGDRLAVGNARARIRAAVLYFEANANDHLVLGTTNRSELLLGYFTKYGDGAADLRPMADLYKTEVRAVARELGVDERFLEKAPSAGLWRGQTDEGELGAGYETIDAVLTALVDCGDSIEVAADRADVSPSEAERLAGMMASTAHKRTQPPAPDLRG